MLRFFGIAAFIFFYSGVKGQIYVGPKVGGQLSYAIFDDKTSRDFFKSRPFLGYNAGAVVAFEIKKRYYLQTELLYSRKGKIIKGKVDEDLRYESFYNHLDLPILFKTDFKSSIGKNKVLRWYGNVGPNVSYWFGGGGNLVSGELEELGQGEGIDYEIKFDQPEDLVTEDNILNVTEANRFQLGLNLGVGTIYETPGGQWLMVDLRFEIGHTFIGKEDGAEMITPDGELLNFFDDLKARNSGLRISVAYLFNSKIEERLKGKSASGKNKGKVKGRPKGPKGKRNKRRR